MPRPKTKEELISLSNENYKKLISFVEALDPIDQHSAFPLDLMNRNIRDVLGHLHYWHLMMVQWYQTGMSGKKPSMPAEGYTWKDVPVLNKEIWTKCQDISLEDTREMLAKSFAEVQLLIQQHSNTELFEKKKYPWTGSTSLGAYLISATSSHYDWALKLMKKALKSRIK